jgi:stearoyl-CoA desaturase (delta-9 desaturase)
MLSLLKDLSLKKTFVILYIHVLGLIGFYRIITGTYHDIRYVYLGFILYLLAGLGVTAGMHRLWAHRTYKAHPIVKYFLLLFATVAAQGSVIHWSRDHRCHHQYSETEKDPHNAKRGFWWSHVGWLLYAKPDDVLAAGKKVDMSDLESDPALAFQHNNFTPLLLLTTYILPTLIPGYLWGSYSDAFLICCNARIIFVWNATWFVNSLAHLWGEKPYDADIGPVENWFVSALTLGEGWHNYHHAYPKDYKAAESLTRGYNLAGWFIKTCSFVGLASELNEANSEFVQKNKLKAH